MKELCIAMKESIGMLGYGCDIVQDAIVAYIDVNDRKYSIDMRVDDDKNITVTCLLGTIQDFVKDSEDFAPIAWTLLACNHLITPFAVSVLDTENGLDLSDPVVLISRVDGNHNINEVCDRIMDDLRKSIIMIQSMFD